MTVAYYINLLVNNYISIFDTEELIIKLDEDNFTDKGNFLKRPTFFIKINQNENSQRKLNLIQQKNFNTSKQNSENIKIEEINNYTTPNTVSKTKSLVSNLNMNYKKDNDNKIPKERNKMKNKNTIETNGDYIHIENILNNLNKSLEIEKDENENTEHYKKGKIINQNFNWFKYIWYFINCCSNNKMIKHYENVRESLISEENMIQNYLDLYNLLKINGVTKTTIRNINKI